GASLLEAEVTSGGEARCCGPELQLDDGRYSKDQTVPYPVLRAVGSLAVLRPDGAQHSTKPDGF
ncbi:hypothetical protein Dimus_012760, partial [Dionaea muscipula]